MKLALLFVDESIVAVDKPAGMLSVPGRGDDKLDCVWTRVREQFADALIVHRLDMATSGIIVLGRGLAAQRALSMAFARREVHKRYVAIVPGRLEPPAGDIDLPLIADWPNRPKQMIDMQRGKPSLTRYRRLAFDEASDTSRIELEPVTGRSHQLRVHLLAKGHPIVGDTLYGSTRPAPRLMLHACRLTLPHPRDGSLIELRSEPPF